MAQFKCTNKFSCDYADSEELFELPVGETKCPKCGVDAVPMEVSGSSRRPNSPVPDRAKLIAAIAVSAALIVGGSVYWWLTSTKQPLGGIGSTSSQPPGVPSTVRPPQDGGRNADDGDPPKLPCAEKECREHCDAATKSNQPDAAKICNRASAVSLLNSGALAAIHKNYEQAEKDYQAALAKDPELTASYYNLAALRVRQDRLKEALEMLDQAYKHGFSGFHFVDQDATFDKLRQDPLWGARFKEQLEAARKVRKMTVGAAAIPPAPVTVQK